MSIVAIPLSLITASTSSSPSNSRQRDDAEEEKSGDEGGQQETLPVFIGTVAEEVGPPKSAEAINVAAISNSLDEITLIMVEGYSIQSPTDRDRDASIVRFLPALKLKASILCALILLLLILVGGFIGYGSRDKTPAPTLEPVTLPAITFPHYQATNTAGDTSGNRVIANFTVCTSFATTTHFSLGNCFPQLPSCMGDQFIRLYSASNRGNINIPPTLTQIAENDDYCGLCSQLNFSVSMSSSPTSCPGYIHTSLNNPPQCCLTYSLAQGCAGNSSCSGTIMLQAF